MWQCPPRAVTAAACALYLSAQNHSISSCLWGSPCHWHISTAWSGRHLGLANADKPWSILGTLRTKEWGVCKLVGIAAAGNQSLDKSTCLLEENSSCFWVFLMLMAFFFHVSSNDWEKCSVSARCDGQGTPACNGSQANIAVLARLAGGLPDLCCFSSSECCLGLVVI